MPLPLLLIASLSQTFRVQPQSPTVRHYHRSLRSESPWKRQGTLYFLVAPSGLRATVPFKASYSAPDPVPTPERDPEREEQALEAAVNAERVERGLGALTPDPLLSETARAHSREMCALGYFDHHSPTPCEATPMTRYQRTLHEWGAGEPKTAIVGENIFYCSITSDTYNVNYAHQSLMNSPGHRANILEARFTKVGVGLYRDTQGRFWVTEMFLRD